MLLAWLQSAQTLPADLKLPVWVKSLMLALGGPLGGVGVFAVALVDSAFLPLAGVNETLVVLLSVGKPLGWALFFGLMATLGSTVGCMIMYSIGRKGGELLLRKRIEEGAHVEKGKLKGVHVWLEQNEFMAVLVSSFLPPPMPFKLFVLAAGGFRVRFKHFVAAIVLGRGLRFFSLALVGAYFGLEVIGYIKLHPFQVPLIALGMILVVYFVSRIATRRLSPATPVEEQITVPSQTAPNASKSL